MSERELSTVLAALKYWLREGQMSAGHERDIATGMGRFEPLTDAEIDALCERLYYCGLDRLIARRLHATGMCCMSGPCSHC